MIKTKRIAVIGSGSWATAIVKILCNNTEKIGWYYRHQNDIDFVKQYTHNPRYLSSVTFDLTKLNLSSNLQETITAADIVILAVPSAFIHDTLKTLPEGILKNKIVFSAIKGIVPEYNLIVGEYLNRIYHFPLENIGVITGPCHAEEVALEKLSYLTLACSDISKADDLCDYIRCRYIKCSSSDDIYGTELSAVLKNVIAVAGGICHGLGYGDNFLSVLVSNAIQEIARFVAALLPTPRDPHAPAGHHAARGRSRTTRG